MPFVLRKEGDTSNPRLVRVFGDQSTTGMLCYYTKIGNQTAFITFLGEGEKYGEGEFDSILWYRYAGRLLTPYDPATQLGDYILHSGKLSTGFSDATQGRPTFFPDLDFTFSGKTYAEVRLPADLSTDDSEPNNSEIRVRGSRINDYDASGAVISDNYGPSANNIREFIYCCKLARKLNPTNIVSRVDWPSYVNARAKCDAQIAWAAGGGDGLTGNYYSDDHFGSVAVTRIDSQISFAFGTDQTDLPAVPFTARWTGFVEAPATGTFTFSAIYDDGIRVTVNGVVLIDDLNVGPARESSGTIALTLGTRYSIQVDYLNAVLTGEVRLSYECTASRVLKQIIPRERLFSSSTVSSSGRTVNRWSGDLVFPGTPLPSALAAIMGRCPGIEWQEVNGKIRFLSDQNRASVFTFYYDPTQSVTPANIVAKSVTATPRDPFAKPNFFIIGFRDKDDELLTQKYVPTDRPDLRDMLDGQLVDPGIQQIGVARQSEAERIGEATMRIATDLDLDVAVKGQKGSHLVGKADRVTLVHPLGDWRGTPLVGHPGPVDMLVQDEVFESTVETANEKTYKLREYDPNFASDTDHGPLLRKRVTDIQSPYDRPPVPVSVTLSSAIANLVNGTDAIAIEGEVQFAQWSYEQRGRVFWRRPNEQIGALTINTSANTIATPAVHSFSDNQPVEMFANGGTLPAPLVENKVYYALIVNSTTVQLSLKPDGLAIDITTAGSGSFQIAPYFAIDTLLSPDRDSLQAAFELSPAEAGTHKVRVMSESTSQQHYELGQQTVGSITIILPITTLARWIETMRAREQDTGLGFYLTPTLASALSDTLRWFGADLWKSRDNVNWKKIAELLTAGVGGVTTNTLNTNGVGLTAADTFNDGSTAKLTVTLDGGATLQNAADQAAVRAGVNAALAGKEKIGFRVATASGGNYDLTDLLRGQKFTEHAMDAHSTGETFVLLDGAALFVPCELGEIGHTVYYKLVSRGTPFSTGTAFSVTLTGESLKGPMPLPVTPASASGYRDTYGDWLFRAIPRNRADEPGRYNIEARSADGVTLYRTLPSFIALPLAAMLIQVTGPFGGDASPGIVRNNVDGNYTTGSGTHVIAKAQQKILQTFASVDVAMGDATGVGDYVAFGLFNDGDPIDLSHMQYGFEYIPSSATLYARDNTAGTSFVALDNSTSKYLNGAHRQQIFLSGTEVRFYVDRQSNPNPVMVSARPPSYPMVVGIICGQKTSVHGIIISENATISTIYGLSQQVQDGGARSTLSVDIYSVMPYPQLTKGQVLHMVF